MKELVLIDEMYGRVFELRPGETIVGRYDSCDVTIPRGSVARRHAVITNHGDVLTLRDNASTNGTYLKAHGTADTTRLGVRPHTLAAGDTVYIGPARLVVRPAEWVGDGPPGAFPLDVTDRSHEVLAAVRGGESAATFSSDERDSAWVAAYRRWRALPASGSIFDLAARLCSPRLLVSIRDALDDPVRWFVDFGLDGVAMLLATEHPVGFLLALDVRLRHGGRGFREAAGRGVRARAQQESSGISQLATERFLAARADTTIDEVFFERLATNVIESARKEGRAWPHETWTHLMHSRSFAIAAANFVFVVRETGEHFRPDNGEALGLDGTVVLGPQATVGVALELDPAWSEHLADYEIVQPFTQQI